MALSQGHSPDALPALRGAYLRALVRGLSAELALHRKDDAGAQGDKSGANTIAIESIQAESGADVRMRKISFLSNVVEQNHRAIKRIIRPVLGFKSLCSARMVIAGIEAMHRIKKGQLDCSEGQLTSAAGQVHSPAF